MSVPKFFEFFRPTLEALNIVESMRVKDIDAELAVRMHLSEEDMVHKLPSQTVYTYINRINWSIQYLKNAGLIERVSHGTYAITEEGRKALRSGEVIDLKYLDRYDSFRAFHTASAGHPDPEPKPEPEETPKEIMDKAYFVIHSELAKELWKSIMDASPAFFEKLVVDLLLAMGYGNGSGDAGMVTGKTGDGGIDGIINEDKLGFDRVYVQAKRWNMDHSVGGPDVHAFIGALVSKGAAKGLFITTSHFTAAAKAAAAETKAVRLILVDGEELTKLMIHYGVGVSVQQIYTVMQTDNDYFEG